MIEGIVYKSIDYKETSKIVYLYTNIGKVSLKVSGLNKKNNPFRNFTITGNIVKFDMTDAKFPTLIDYEMISSPLNHMDDINYIESLKVFINVLNYLPEDVDNLKAYQFTENMLKLLCDNPKKILSIFLIKMLYIFGVNPNLKECNSCHKKEELTFFDYHNAVSYCKNCSNKLNNYHIWYEYYYSKNNPLELSDINYDELLNEIATYYKKFVNIELK